jgi:hypothetical protein
MSAGTAKLLRNGRTGSITSDETSWEAVYQVITTDKNDGPATVAFAPGIPVFNSVYSIGSDLDVGATVSSITPQQDDDNPQVWTVRVRWSTKNLDPQDPGETNDPTLRPNIIRWRMEPYTEAVRTDRDGSLIQTANKEWFDPFPEVTRYRPVVNIEKNFSAFNDSFMFDYTGAVNSDEWLGGDPDYWLCRLLQVEPMHEFGFSYKRVIAEFAYNRDTWALVLPHKGTLYKPSLASVTPIPKPGKELVHLTSDGVLSSSHVHDLTFNLQPAEPFQALNLL